MNEMDLIKDFCAEQVPPGPEQLAAARARVVAAIEGTVPSGSALSGPGRARRLPRRARGFLVVAAAGAITAVAGLVIAGTVTGSGPASPGPAQHTGGGRNPISWNGNLYPLGPPGVLGAEKTTVAGIQAKVGYPVPVPSTAAASRANLTQAWVAPHNNRQAALVFDKGKVDILMHPATYQSALRYFHAYVREKKENGVASAWIGQVNGRPALVIIGRGTNANHSKPAAVHFYRNGVLISIYSNTYGTHALLAIADSMH